MSHRIEVMLKPELKDALGEKTAKRCREDLSMPVNSVRTVKVFLIDANLSPNQLEQIASGPFSDPVTQQFSIDEALAKNISSDWDWLIEVGFKPGVTDNEGKIAREAITLLLGESSVSGVYTSTQYLITGDLTKDQAETVATELLANQLIQRVLVVSRDDLETIWSQSDSPFFVLPKVTQQVKIQIESINLSSMTDQELIKLSSERTLALNLEEMKKIRDYFTQPHIQEERAKLGLGTEITDVELEALAQTWSEHCKHKIFNAIIKYKDEKGSLHTIESLFDTCIRKATQEIRDARGDSDWCLSVFKDNAGVIAIDDKWAVAFKVETHNSPSALDPYGGALTGIVGVNRDPFGTGMGAKLVFNTDIFCFGPPDYTGQQPKGLLHPKRIFEGVREGVEHGGNQSGIPTVNGSIVFDDRYVGKPLVFCGTGGILPRSVCNKKGYEKQAQPGDAIVMCGGRIGKDGIHGATFSSEELHEGSPATAVQIGDPITQKKMTDFLLRARDLCLYNSITDNGAGGLSSSVGEMALESGGFELYLDRAPLKYPGLQPWEIFLSEAQERMTVAVPQGKLDHFLSLAQKMDVEATVLGTFTDSGKFHCIYDGKTVAWLDLDFVHDGVPRLHLEAEWTPPNHEEPDIEMPQDLGNTLKSMLRRWNICSKEYVVRQYDHEVQGGSVIKPMVGVQADGPSDAAVIRSDLNSFSGLVVAHGLCPRYSDIDTFHMAMCAVDEAVRNAICVGANMDHLAGLDNFCWCDPVESEKTPDGKYKLAQLVRANQGLYQICTTFGVPCISGKDSMKNDCIIGGVKISIPPTLLFSVVGRIDDVRNCQTMDAKNPGDLVYIVGNTYNELGGSEYYAMFNAVGNSIPQVRPEEAKTTYICLSRAIREGLVASCHDCSDGGLGVCLAETAFSGGLGMTVDISRIPGEQIRPDLLLFSESQSRFVVTVSKDMQRDFESVMSGVSLELIGEVNDSEMLSIEHKGEKIILENVASLKQAWQSPLSW